MSEVSVRHSGIQGSGVFADRDFETGESVLEIDDSDPVFDRAALSDAQEIFIDVFVGADGVERTIWMKSPECLINHSCDPNTFVRTDPATGVRRNLARRKIRSGDELTWDYVLNIPDDWVPPIPCKCGAARCRGVIQGTYFTLPRNLQDEYLPILDPPFRRRFAERIRALGLDGTSDQP
jgi:hypothetical protein